MKNDKSKKESKSEKTQKSAPKPAKPNVKGTPSNEDPDAQYEEKDES